MSKHLGMVMGVVMGVILGVVVSFLIFVCVAGASLTGQNAKPVASEAPKATYDRIVAQINQGQQDVDWTALRFAAAGGGASPDFDFVEARTRMFAALNSDKYDVALKEANDIISHNMANCDAHYVALIAYNHTGQKQAADAEKAKVVALAHSIMGNDDAEGGNSAERAWVAVNVDEEYFVLRLLGMRPRRQSLSTKGKKSYDVMTVTDARDAGHEYTYWFDTTFAMSAMADGTTGGSKQK